MPYVFLLIQQFIGSSTHIVGKVVVGHVSPALVLILRASLASTLLLGYLRIRRGPFPAFTRRDVGRLFLLGFISIPLNQFAFLFGLQYTSASDASLLYALTPALVVFAQRFVMREHVRKRRMLAVGIAFAGVTIILAEHGFSFGSTTLMGDLIVFTAVIAWTAYTLMARRFIVRYGAIESTAYSMATGTVLALPLLFILPGALAFSSLTGNDMMAIAYLGGITSTFGYVFWFIALKHIPASRVAVFTNMQPVITTLLAVLFLGQSVSPQFIVGGVITLAGVLLTQVW
jgi:drug/metabolite transporter (DMT)-like permease